jgi:hypothetical protein
MKRALAALLVIAFAFASPARAQETSLQEAVRLVGERRFVEALAAARKGEDPLSIAQGELYVLHHAGALSEALEAGLTGLEAAPEDPWLLEQCTDIALNLGAARIAGRLARELQEVVPESDLERASGYLEWAYALEVGQREEARALTRARITMVVVVLLSIACALLAARRTTGGGSEWLQS